MKKNNFYKEIYRLQKAIRLTENKIAKNYKKYKMRCPTHLSIGQEAVAAASGFALKNNDISISYHRSHAHYIAKGGSIKKLFAELFGFKEGCSKGIGGSMHLIDIKKKFYASTAIVSNSIPVGVGIAYSLKLNKQKNIVCIYIGDASLEEGVFYESLNFAIIKKLPIVFICENNFYSVYTHLKDRQPKDREFYKLANSLGAKGYKLRQDNPFKLFKELKKINEKVRKNPFPHFIEIKTYRYLEHCGPNDDTKLGYRTNTELNKWKKNDTINFSANYLIKNKIMTKEKILKLDQNVKKQIDSDFDSMKRLRSPKFKDIMKLTYR